jgi:diaminopropionate ammonia-lyase
MQGYLTLFDEAFEQLGEPGPTHIFIPCGVGALAASLQAFLVEAGHRPRPRLAVVEAAAADCYFRSMAAGGRSIVPVTGPMTTRMVGLACGEPTRAGWDILRQYADFFMRCTDDVALAGMRRLARPYPPDPAVESGECGAVTLGCLCRLMSPDHAAERQAMGLGPDSRILLFSTEGATDPETYRQAILGRPGNAARGR